MPPAQKVPRRNTLSPTSPKRPEFQSGLCSRCSPLILGFLELFPHDHVFHLEHRWLRSNARCKGCSLLRSVFPKELEGSALSLRLTDTKPSYKVWEKWTNTIDPLLGVIKERVLLPDFHEEGELEFEDLKLPITNCIVEICSSKVEAALEALQEPRINFGILRTWMHECLETHTESCARSAYHSGVHGLRLIQVRTRRLVLASLQFEYAALSYVWGNVETSQYGDELPQAVPKTIEDALEASSLLGLSHLWVDKYCIPQHNEAEKQSQISQMHLIYQRAAITIIAAAGIGAEHGIPGINSTPLHPPPHLLIGQRRILTTMCFRPTAAIQFSSKWGSRGWTYQEAILSTRRLVFTERQVYFECNSPDSCCGIDEPIRRLQDQHDRRLHGRNEDGFNKLSERYQGSMAIWNHISMFSRRELTWEGDRINALMGIFGDFRNSGHIDGQFFGIPITSPFNNDEQFETRTAWTNRLLAGLCWDLVSPADRRDQFPSWSWAGWKGQLRLATDSDNGVKLDVLGDFTRNDRIHLWLKPKDGAIIRSEELKRSSVLDTLQTTRILYLEAPILQFRFKSREDFLYPVLENRDRATPFVKHRDVFWSRLHLTKKVLEVSLCRKVWDGIPFENSDGDVRVLVLERINDHFQRLGHFDVLSGDFSGIIELREENGDGSLSYCWRTSKKRARHRIILKRKWVELH